MGLSLAARVLQIVLVLASLVLAETAPRMPVGSECARKCCARGKQQCCRGKRDGQAGMEARSSCCERGAGLVRGSWNGTAAAVEGDTFHLVAEGTVAAPATAEPGEDLKGKRRGRAPPVLVWMAVV